MINKQLKILTIVLIFSVIGVFIFYSYSDESNNITLSNNNSQIYKQLNSVNEDIYFETSELHWNHMPLTYTFVDEENFFPIRKERIEKALSEIEILTDNKIKFEYVLDNPDITFISTKSSKIERDQYDEYSFLYYNEDAGSSYQQTLAECEYYYEDNILTDATIYFYGGIEKDCLKYPATEMHEILHAFGIEHSKYAGSVMSAIEHYCINEIKIEIDGIIFEDLKNRYETKDEIEMP